MSAQIIALGTASPSCLIAQNEALEHAKTRCRGTEKQLRVLERLYKRSTVGNRGSVAHASKAGLEGNSRSPIGRQFETTEFYPAPTSAFDLGPSTAQRMRRYEQEAIGLAENAVRNALACACDSSVRTSCDTITNLVTVSCTGFAAPGFDIELIRRLGLSNSTQRHHLGFMGCHGAINGLRVASALAEQHPQQHVLLCAAELCSIHFQYGWNKDSILANSLFADGAAAVVLTASDTTIGSWGLTGSASYLVPDSLEAMSWKVCDNGFVMTLSALVPNLISIHLRHWIDNWLEKLGKHRSDIQAWAIHPGGPRILDTCAESLDLSEHDLRFSRDILAKHGNMSSPTVLFILERIQKELGPVPTAVLAFGPGLTIEAALLA
jgi:predicted naringenin-chalcone synthase